MTRSYLDWNATAPIMREAQEAMRDVLSLSGNPSSVHFEGRAAKAVIEKTRATLMEAFGATHSDVVFTSGATEAIAHIMSQEALSASALEHDAVYQWRAADLENDEAGQIMIEEPSQSVQQTANSETGILQNLTSGIAFCDAVQSAGKIDFDFEGSGASAAVISAHKFGGPKGVGALLLRKNTKIKGFLRGGGQEFGHRPGTENVPAIAGFGAAIQQAIKELREGVWERVSQLRDYLEGEILSFAGDAIIVGREYARLPNTSNIVIPGWPGETQVIAMDLMGFSISSGSACSSGKVQESRVLKSLGYDAASANSAIRLSFGPSTSKASLEEFLTAYKTAYIKYKKRGA